jgi:hypothetical protein
VVHITKEGESSYTAKIVATISDEQGAKVEVVTPELTVVDLFFGKSDADIAAMLAKQAEDDVAQNLQKGDTSKALSKMGNCAGAATTTSGARHTGSDGTSLALTLLGKLQDAAKVVIITATNVIEVIQTLSKVTQLKEGFNTSHIVRIFDLELKFASKVSGSAMSKETAGTFVKALGDMLDPSFLDFIIEQDFGAFPQAGNETYSLDARNFTRALSINFGRIKVEVGNALLRSQIQGEASIKISAGGDSGVSMSAQKQSKGNVGQALKEFPGGEFKMPEGILDETGEETGCGGVQIFVGYSDVMWPGNVPAVAASLSLNQSLVDQNVTLTSVTSITTRGKGVHSLSLGKCDGSGSLMKVKNLTKPIVMYFKVNAPPMDDYMTGGLATNEIRTQVPQCLYWDVDKGEWSSEGVNTTFFNGTHMGCSSDHLTDFGTAFTDVAGSLNFEVFVNVDVLLDDLAQKIINNPYVFVLLFATYFFCGMACLFGAMKDGNDFGFTLYRKEITAFESYTEASQKIAVPRSSRWTRTIFFLVNTAFLVLSITDLAICIVSWVSGSVFKDISRGIGVYLLFMYAVFQFALVMVGFQNAGFWRAPGRHALFLVLFLVMMLVAVFLNAFALDFVASFHGGGAGVGWGNAPWFMKVMWKGLSTWDQERLQAKLVCCGFDAAFAAEPNGIVTPVCPMDAATGTNATDFCLSKLEEHLSGTISLLATLQLICSVLLIPLGTRSYVTWQALRQKELALQAGMEEDTFVDLFGKPPLAPPKAVDAEVDAAHKERAKSRAEKDAAAAATTNAATKPASRWGNVRTQLKYVLRELAENHHILEVICSTKVDFPRRDRALCFLAYALMMFVTSGLSYHVDFAGTSCCLDDDNYAPVVEKLQAPYAWNDRGVPTHFTSVENVTQRYNSSPYSRTLALTLALINNNPLNYS